ncbi:hypothetical protein ACFPRL_20345 [Pseudoclavibacter helvolus]
MSSSSPQPSAERSLSARTGASRTRRLKPRRSGRSGAMSWPPEPPYPWKCLLARCSTRRRPSSCPRRRSRPPRRPSAPRSPP